MFSFWRIEVGDRPSPLFTVTGNQRNHQERPLALQITLKNQVLHFLRINLLFNDFTISIKDQYLGSIDIWDVEPFDRNLYRAGNHLDRCIYLQLVGEKAVKTIPAQIFSPQVIFRQKFPLRKVRFVDEILVAVPVQDERSG